eukprot:3115146-Rhodomonas_salina.1
MQMQACWPALLSCQSGQSHVFMYTVSFTSSTQRTLLVMYTYPYISSCILQLDELELTTDTNCTTEIRHHDRGPSGGRPMNLGESRVNHQRSPHVYCLER